MHPSGLASRKPLTAHHPLPAMVSRSQPNLPINRGGLLKVFYKVYEYSGLNSANF